MKPVRRGIARFLGNREQLSATLLFTLLLAAWDLWVSHLLPLPEIVADAFGFFACGFLVDGLYRRGVRKALYPLGAVGGARGLFPRGGSLPGRVLARLREMRRYHAMVLAVLAVLAFREVLLHHGVPFEGRAFPVLFGLLAAPLLVFRDVGRLTRMTATVLLLLVSWEGLLSVHLPLRTVLSDVAPIFLLATFLFMDFRARLEQSRLGLIGFGEASAGVPSASGAGPFLEIPRSGDPGPPSGLLREGTGAGGGSSPSGQPAAPSASVLIVDADPKFLHEAGRMLRAEGIAQPHLLEDPANLLPFLALREVSLLVLGLGADGAQGADLLRKVRQEHPDTPVIVLSGSAEVVLAVECMRDGAADYLLRPVERERFLSAVRRAIELRDLREQVATLREQALSPPAEREVSFHGIRTRNPKMLSLVRYVAGISSSRQPVLLTGETGVGKELLARAIHERSGVRGPFVAVNVAGLDDTMFSDTLFGHRKGAFTGAHKGREGLVAQASGGTLFLDEIGDLTEPSQVKLLRLIEAREYYPLGADLPKPSDARIVCATNRSLRAMAAEGRFRKDLYYRLSAHPVHIPPLRERPEDIPLLADHFLETAAAELGKRKPTAPPELSTLLSAYDFPGNIRELRSMFLDAVSQHRGGVLSLEAFRRIMEEHRARHAPRVPYVPVAEGEAPFPLPFRFPTLEEAENYLVTEALKRARNNQGIAAMMLGLSRAALNKRLCRAREEGVKSGQEPDSGTAKA